MVSRLRSRKVVVLASLLLAVHVVLMDLGSAVWLTVVNGVCETAIGVLVVIAFLQAGQRSSEFGRRFWYLLSTAFGFWAVEHAIIVYERDYLRSPQFTYWPTVILFFLFALPFALALFLDEAPNQEAIRWQQTLDFAQIGIVMLALFLAFFYIPFINDPSRSAVMAKSLGWHLVRDGALAGAFAWRGWFSHSSQVRYLFRRMTWFLALYGVVALLFFYAQVHWSVETQLILDVLTDMVRLVAIVLAATSITPVELAVLNERPSNQTAFLVGQLLLFPLLVAVMAPRIASEQPAVAALIVGASFACFGVRLYITQQEANRAVQVLRASEARFRNLASGFSSGMGESFLQSLVTHAAEAVGAKYVLLGQIKPGTPRTIRTLAVSDRGVVKENFEYPLDGTPCEEVLRGSICYHPTNVAALFPRDVLLAEMGVDSYLASPVVSSAGVPLGILVFLHDALLKQPELARSILQICAARAGTELERMSAEEALRAAAAGVSEGTGEDFFHLLVQHLAMALHVDCVFVGALSAAQQSTIQTVAVYSNGVLKPNFEYQLDDTPCHGIFREQQVYFPLRVRESFPNDALLHELQAEAYLGVPLFASTGEGIGILVALHHGSMDLEGLARSIVHIYSTRAATELERLRSEESLRASEARFRQIQKMQALGTLAAGIAHDFNNVLTVIKGGSSLALDHVSKDSPAYEDLIEVQKAAGRAAALTGQLLAFSRQQVLHGRTLEINQAIKDLSTMLDRVLGEDITLSLELDPNSRLIHVDPTQFDQVLMNLVVNARDAMPNGGTLRFSTRRVQVDQATLPTKPGDYILLQVTDSGLGMDKDTQERVFEPFFTTKAVGAGTGLGLATVYGIMEQLGGHVMVESELGKGTTFSLYFPCSGSMVDHASPAPGAATSSGHETILLVEDDSGLRHLTHRILEAAGYAVLSASGVEDAERILLEFSGDIALALTDVVMADGGGEALVAKLARARPDTRILFMSGYTDGRVPAKYLTEDQAFFLAKPFEPAELTGKIRRLLDAERTKATSSS